MAIARAQEARPAAKFLGLQSCQSSSCHGGAAGHGQSLVWANKDFHSRAFAILATSRSDRIGETLKIKDVRAEARCTICHSPFQTLSSTMLGATAHPDEGVSCESCHGAAEPWVRAHTRRDYTHGNRLAAGMTDLKNLYTRANHCVACHENLDADILQAGHPELIFELDAMTVSEPPHWKDEGAWLGPRAWLVGQAVALREQSWRLEKHRGSSDRWKALAWLLQKVSREIGETPPVATVPEKPAREDFSRAQQAGDSLARAAAGFDWSEPLTAKVRRELSSCSMEFAVVTDAGKQVHQAETLVQALDRLSTALKRNGQASSEIDKNLDVLFDDVKIPSEFKTQAFSQHLSNFHLVLSKANATSTSH